MSNVRLISVKRYICTNKTTTNQIFLPMCKFVLYTRVSTQRQGLGLEAQQAAAAKYISDNGGEIVAHYSEKESGKNDKRPQLAAALETCKREGATLLIAKLDRLSRKVSFIFSLKDSGVKFLALDLPEFNTLTLAIFAAMAQQERELTSQRTSAALQALKAKGVKLGRPGASFTDQQRAASAISRKQAARDNENNRRAWAVIELLGNQTLQTLADYLNERGFVTARGGKWSATQIFRLRDLYAK